jgi:hypothetical protein
MQQVVAIDHIDKLFLAFSFLVKFNFNNLYNNMNERAKERMKEIQKERQRE